MDSIHLDQISIAVIRGASEECENRELAREGIGNGLHMAQAIETKVMQEAKERLRETAAIPMEDLLILIKAAERLLFVDREGQRSSTEGIADGVGLCSRAQIREAARKAIRSMEGCTTRDPVAKAMLPGILKPSSEEAVWVRERSGI